MASPSAGAGKCAALAKAIVLAPGVEARPGHPWNGSESAEAEPDYLTLLPPLTGRGKSGGPEPEHAQKEPAADKAPPC